MEGQKLKKITEVDRLSNLPDGLILHILSLTDTKYAVQTCVLSKKWKNLWMHISGFNFYSKSFSRLEDFRSCILHALNRCKTANVLAFHVHNSNYLKMKDKYTLDRVTDLTISHCLQELTLSYGPRRWKSHYLNKLDLARSIFRCQSLRVVRLEGLTHFGDLPDSLELRSLNSLTLRRVMLSSNNDCYDLFSRCGKLQNLVLDEVDITISNIFNISAPQLVSLTICNPKFTTSKSSSDAKVVVRAPKLTSFVLSVRKLFYLTICDSPLLYYVEVKAPHFGSDYSDFRRNFLLLIDILCGLGNARSLALSGKILEILSKNYSKLKLHPSPFRNVESFKVPDQQENKILMIVLWYLLRDSPIADRFNLKFGKGTGNQKFATICLDEETNA